MSEALKNLGQSLPAINTLTSLYAVPAAKSAVVSTVLVCNQSDEPGTFRLSHAVAAASNASAQYLYWDEPIPANRTFAITLGLSLAATDVLRGQSSNGQMSFNVFGAEITP